MAELKLCNLISGHDKISLISRILILAVKREPASKRSDSRRLIWGAVPDQSLGPVGLKLN